MDKRLNLELVITDISVYFYYFLCINNSKLQQQFIGVDISYVYTLVMRGTLILVKTNNVISGDAVYVMKVVIMSNNNKLSFFFESVAFSQTFAD